MAELSSGKAGQQENAPVDLDAAGLATNGALNGAGPTNGQVALEAQRVVGPASSQSPTDQQLQQLQVSTQGVSTNGAEVMTLAQAQEILKSIGNSELTIGPNSSAQAGQAQAQIQSTNGAQSANGAITPPVQTGGPVNLDQLAAQGDQQQPVQQAQQVQQQVQQAAQQQQQQATQQQQGSRPVITDDTLIPTPFGEMKLSEAKSLMMRRKDWEKKERDLMEKTRLVDGQASLIQRAAQSKFGATFIAALNAGGSEDDAVRAGLSAYGQAPATQAQPAQPEPILPPDKEDPHFEAKWAEYLAKLTARSASEAVDARLRPLEQRLVQQEQAQTNAYAQAQRAQVDAQATLQHNRDLFHIYVDPYLPEGLSDRQREIVSEYLEQVKRQENIPIDMSRRANDSDMRLLATYAFPGGQLPAHVISQLATNGSAAQQQAQYPYQQQAATQQAQQQQQTGQPQLPPTLANLPDWQKNALITQATQVLNMYRTSLGANANGQLPGIPVQPALYAGANPTASQLSPMNPSPAMRPEERIRSTLQSIPRSQ